ncbi:PD-(D/E)XK motif protein [Marinobacter sp. CA1]|uniref:PD-(D/E)XK motif protein n=1 Tax=Marinobacter sp. CA1 TaxID=2817656 RepID=UPI001D099BEB|nr:PD-(D/E)XK motif protein [Marinobacter sp. CA1]UDL05224.1 PD-(D/E)XK motif protein [Marinobacter sp. CA1]
MSSDGEASKAFWRRLREDKCEAGALSIPTIPASVVTLHGPPRHALGPFGEARLLLPIGVSETIPNLPSTAALAVSDCIYTYRGRSQRFLDIVCQSPDLERVFSEVVDELLSRVSEGVNALEAATSTLYDFQELLIPRPDKAVNFETVIGLAGELVFLSSLLDITSEAIHSWRGPLKERHDFRRGALAFEVKTSSRAGNHEVVISAVDQLLQPTNGKLMLVHQVLEAVNDGNISISSLAAEVGRKTADPKLFADLLEKAGCTDPDSAVWNKYSFNNENQEIYRVGNDFPRIIPETFQGGSLPRGVLGISYPIDLSVASALRLDDIERRTALQEFCS